MLSCFDTILACDRQSDEWTDIHGIVRAYAAHRVAVQCVNQLKIVKAHYILYTVNFVKGSNIIKINKKN